MSAHMMAMCTRGRRWGEGRGQKHPQEIGDLRGRLSKGALPRDMDAGHGF